MPNARRATFWLVLAGLLAGGTCTAGSDIPNLVGTWTVESEGGVLARSGEPRDKTHHRGEFSHFKGEAVFTKQEGRIVHGTFTSPRTQERLIGGISLDNKGVYLADEDGFVDGVIVDNDTLHTVYRHISPTDTAIGIGVWTRKK